MGGMGGMGMKVSQLLLPHTSCSIVMHPYVNMLHTAHAYTA